MPGVRGSEVDKKEIGARIKRLRKETGLRQWQLAELIGATQPAIHMYERGVLPEPKRLLALARIGDTTVEWILTGRHWEGGAEEMRRAPEDVCRLAHHLKEYSDEDRKALVEAARLIRVASRAVSRASAAAEEEEEEEFDHGRALKALRESVTGTLPALEAAMSLHEAVCKAAVDSTARRIRAAGSSDDAAEPEAAGRSRRAGHGARRTFRTRVANIEPVRGNIYRLDGPLSGLNEILRDRVLRGQFESMVERLLDKLESKKKKTGRTKGAPRGK